MVENPEDPDATIPTDPGGASPSTSKEASTAANRHSAPQFSVNEDRLPDYIGPYRILELLGTSMALVFKAEQQQPARTVVLKIPRGGQLMDPAVRARFEREAALAARLNHSGIVTVLDMGEADGVPYYTMPYIEGETLGQAFRTRFPDMESRLRLFKEVCQVVGALHDEQLVHRDLKPSNILIDKYGKARLLDFGLAKALDSEDPSVITQAASSMGTPHYMAPEQTGIADDITPAADVYALGVMLYQLVTDELPYTFTGFGFKEINIIRSHVPKPPSKVRRGITTQFDNLVGQCLAKKPEKRPKTANAVLNAIEAIDVGEPTINRPAPNGKLALVKKGLMGLTALVILGLGAFVIQDQLDRRASRDGTELPPKQENGGQKQNAGGGPIPVTTNDQQIVVQTTPTNQVAPVLVSSSIKTVPVVAGDHTHPAGTPSAPVHAKTALVIGATSVSPNPLAQRNAVAMAGALQRIGFHVEEDQDVAGKNLREIVTRFCQSISTDGQTVFYFSGYAFQRGGKNYLLPAYRDEATAVDLEDDAVPLQWIVEQIEQRGADANILILDCLPAPAVLNHPPGFAPRSGSESPGTLLVMQMTDKPANLDSAQPYTPYTDALVRRLHLPVRIQDLFSEISQEALRNPATIAPPIMSGSLADDAYFNKPLCPAPAIGPGSQNVLSVLSLARTLPQDFDVTLSVMPEREVFLDEDVISFRVQANRDCYIALWVHQSNGESVKLFPNAFEPNNHISSQQARMIPSPGNENYRVRVQPPFGIDVYQIIAATDRLVLERMCQSFEKLYKPSPDIGLATKTRGAALSSSVNLHDPDETRWGSAEAVVISRGAR